VNIKLVRETAINADSLAAGRRCPLVSHAMSVSRRVQQKVKKYGWGDEIWDEMGVAYSIGGR
jgi:hypothetical protein